MKILVCFKVVPDFDTVLRGDWDDFEWDTDLFYAKKQINPFDESALELALRLCEELNRREPGAASCTAVTVAGALGAAYKKQLFAVGFEQVVRIACEQAEFSPGQVARLLAEYAKDKGFDLILTGAQSGYGDTGLVPPMLAELLGLPFIGRAEDVAIDGGAPEVVHQGDFGRYSTQLLLPGLVAVGNSPLALRMATLRASLAAAKREVAVLEGECAFVPPVLLKDKTERACRFLEGDEAIGEICSLMKGGLLE